MQRRAGPGQSCFLELASHWCPSRFQARFDAGELITQRELVSRQVSEDLTERAATFGLILDDVSLVRVLPFSVVLSGVCPNRSSGEENQWMARERRAGGLDMWTVFVCLQLHGMQRLLFQSVPLVLSLAFGDLEQALEGAAALAY